MRRWLLLCAVALLAACSDSSSPATPIAASAASTSISSSAAPVDVAPAPRAVTRRSIVVEDTSRPTNAAPDRGLPEKPSRTLPLTILVPDGDGPFPIVEYSHGTGGNGAGNSAFLEPIAAAGYIVVAPTFPLSSGESGTIFDYGNQPLDAWFAIDTVIGLGNDPNDELHGRVDADHIAMGGHSLGAMTTIGAVYNSCCRRPTVDAAFSLSGVEAPFLNGDFSQWPATPLLLVHGDKDATIVSTSSDDIYAKTTGPTAFLRFPDADHSGIFDVAHGALLSKAVLAWLDRWLRDDATRLDALPAEVSASGRLATLTTKGY